MMQTVSGRMGFGAAGTPLHLVGAVLHIVAPLADDIATESLVNEA